MIEADKWDRPEELNLPDGPCRPLPVPLVAIDATQTKGFRPGRKERRPQRVQPAGSLDGWSRHESVTANSAAVSRHIATEVQRNLF